MTNPTDLKNKPWNDGGFSFPQEILSVTGMLSNQEKKMLYYLALHFYSGKGEILDMGAFLGGSTLCLAAALKQRSISRPLLHTYDFFRWAL